MSAPHRLPILPRALTAWPLPALIAWTAAWLLFAADGRGAGAAIAATALGLLACRLGDTPWRRRFIAAGFPLSWLMLAASASLPTWVWLLPLAVLAVLYPVKSWRDAPLFPTPGGALRGLAQHAPLAADARVLDAGCGLGAGLQALRQAYPQAALHGLEWSWPLRIACGWRTRFARVRRGDIWAADWSTYQMVYLFQRPESMPRAVDKAGRELAPGAWLASLEFEATDLTPYAVHTCPDGRPVWLYRAPFTPRNGCQA
jgi:hypothetical protein